MNRELSELRRAVPEGGRLAPEVSAWSVGMHVQHVCLAMIGVCRSLVASEPPAPESHFHLVTWAVLTLGRIPRGRGEAPEPSIPRAGISGEELSALLDESEIWLARAGRASPDQWFRHFAFGVLDRERALRFLEVHNRHHLRIIRDILRA